MNARLRPVPLVLGGLLCISSFCQASEPELLPKTKKNGAESTPTLGNKLVGTPPAPEVSATRDALPALGATPTIKLAAHEPVIQMPEMTIGGKVKPMSKQTEKERYRLPQTTESITRDKIDSTINLANTEDAIKYLPSIQVRNRYIGDTNAPVGMRTSGTSASARNLIYADGILLSSLLGNNNTNTGSPRWNTVSPGEIERVDVMYGPFSAAYSGNSIGGVINITTRMPKSLKWARMRSPPGRPSISMAPKTLTTVNGIRDTLAIATTIFHSVLTTVTSMPIANP